MIPALEATGVTVDVGPRRDVRAVDGVDLLVPPGDWLTIIGPNGAGKSTLLGALAGVVDCGGDVRVHGMTLAGLDRRARARALAFVVQQPLIPRGLTVEQYVLLGRTAFLSRFGRDTDRDVAAVASAITRLGLDDFAGRRVDTLSGGERQRAVLARAMAQEAPLLMLDEPTTALDVGFQQEVLDLVDELRTERDLTVVSTMHDLTLSAQYADRLVLLRGGRVVAAGDPQDLLDADLLAGAYGARVEVVEHDGRTIVIPAKRNRRRSR